MCSRGIFCVFLCYFINERAFIHFHGGILTTSTLKRGPSKNEIKESKKIFGKISNEFYAIKNKVCAIKNKFCAIRIIDFAQFHKILQNLAKFGKIYFTKLRKILQRYYKRLHCTEC